MAKWRKIAKSSMAIMAYINETSSMAAWHHISGNNQRKRRQHGET